MTCRLHHGVWGNEWVLCIVSPEKQAGDRIAVDQRDIRSHCRRLHGHTCSPEGLRGPSLLHGRVQASLHMPGYPRGQNWCCWSRLLETEGSQPRPVEGTHLVPSLKTSTIYLAHRRENSPWILCTRVRLTLGCGHWPEETSVRAILLVLQGAARASRPDARA